MGGNLYQQMGIMGDCFKERGCEITEADLGRYNVTSLICPIGRWVIHTTCMQAKE